MNYNPDISMKKINLQPGGVSTGWCRPQEFLELQSQKREYWITDYRKTHTVSHKRPRKNSMEQNQNSTKEKEKHKNGISIVL